MEGDSFIMGVETGSVNLGPLYWELEPINDPFAADRKTVVIDGRHGVDPEVTKPRIPGYNPSDMGAPAIAPPWMRKELSVPVDPRTARTHAVGRDYEAPHMAA